MASAVGTPVLNIRWLLRAKVCLLKISQIPRQDVREFLKNRDRTIPINPDSPLQKLLTNRKPKKCKPDDLVFPAKNGGVIEDHNFRNCAWVSILEQANIPYRKPYNTRHTFISHTLKSGTHLL